MESIFNTFDFLNSMTSIAADRDVIISFNSMVNHPELFPLTLAILLSLYHRLNHFSISVDRFVSINTCIIKVGMTVIS